jgi:hypothetical protein
MAVLPGGPSGSAGSTRMLALPAGGDVCLSMLLHAVGTILGSPGAFPAGTGITCAERPRWTSPALSGVSLGRSPVQAPQRSPRHRSRGHARVGGPGTSCRNCLRCPQATCRRWGLGLLSRMRRRNMSATSGLGSVSGRFGGRASMSRCLPIEPSVPRVRRSTATCLKGHNDTWPGARSRHTHRVPAPRIAYREDGYNARTKF